MVHLILESLFKVVCMGMVFINDQMENTMKAIGLTIKCPIKGNQSGRMEENTLVNTVKIKSMGKAYLKRKDIVYFALIITFLIIFSA